MITPSDRRTDPAAQPDPPAWVVWPVRVLVAIVVVPIRLLWEAVAGLGSLLRRYLLEPLVRHVLIPCARLLRHVVWRPLVWLLRTVVVGPVAWLCRHLVIVPATWLWSLRHVIGRFLDRYVGRPLAALARLLLWVPLRVLVTYLLIRPVVWLVGALRPVWRAAGAVWRLVGRAVVAVWRLVGRAAGAVWHLTGRALRLLGRGLAALGRLGYRYALRPVGVAIGWAWTHTAAPFARGVLVPAGRWVRHAVLRPAAATVRGVLVALGVRR